MDERTRVKISLAMRGSRNPFYGKKHSASTRAKLSEIAKHRLFSDDTKRKMSESKMGERNTFYGKHHTNDTKQKISCAKRGQRTRLGAKHRPETITKMSVIKLGNNYSVGHTMPMESRLKLSRERKGNWMAELWADPVFKERTLRAIRVSQNMRPNGCETKILGYLNEIQPNKWKYVGDWALDIGGRNPDFHNGGDELVEHFGQRWHGEKARCYEETEEGRVAHFAKYGYRTLIIWESELKHPELVKARIAEFAKRS